MRAKLIPFVMAVGLDVLGTVIGITVLVFVGKVLAELCVRANIPEVVGEVSAGIILGPAALGSAIIIRGQALIQLNELMLAFAEIGGIIILFSAGLEFTFADFRRASLPSFVIGIAGVVLPFFLGYQAVLILGFEWTVALLVGATLSATSIAVTVRVLDDLGKTQTKEAKILINAAVIDDVLGLAVLSVVMSAIYGGELPTFTRLVGVTVQSIAIWLAMLVSAVLILPRALHLTTVALRRSEGTIEVLATTSCFGLAALASAIGLSPVVGAFAAGMAFAGSHMIHRIKEYIGKLKLIFGPLFFAVIGTYLNISQIFDVNALFVAIIFTIAIIGKVVGCGIPASIFTRSRASGLRIGIGMISRGEVGFIILGLGFTSGVLKQDIYSALVMVILGTTVISPILLRRAYATTQLR